MDLGLLPRLTGLLPPPAPEACDYSILEALNSFSVLMGTQGKQDLQTRKRVLTRPQVPSTLTLDSSLQP